MGRSGKLGAGIAFAVTTWVAAASAQTAQPGFGERDAFVFSVENVFGFQSQSFGDTDIDSKGLQPAFWGDVGLFGVRSSGFSYGALLGVSHLRLSQSSSSNTSSITVLRLGPRLGWAGATKNSFLGFWLRGGPSVFALTTDDDSSDASWFYALAISAEAYMVITPAPHLGIVAGPHFDIHLIGNDPDGSDDEAKYSSVGFGVGLMGEFY